MAAASIATRTLTFCPSVDRRKASATESSGTTEVTKSSDRTQCSHRSTAR